VVVKTPPGADEGLLALADLLPRALGLNPRPTGPEPAQAILWIGTSNPNHLPPGGRIDGGHLRLRGAEIAPQTDTVFAVWSTDFAGGTGVEALYWSPTLAAAQAVVRKIPHYGKYSYLAFDQATNILKGTWPVTASPLRIEWPTAQGAVR
jgi:hypothetical protein